MATILDLLKKLISCPSITPEDAGCQKLISEFLTPLGFTLENLRFGKVDNLWARLGKEAPLIVFAGHTDVVPPGPLEKWLSDPFTPTEREGLLYGRGATDMKSGLAAMLVATQNFLHKYPKLKGSIAFLLTSDEEGPSIDGTQKVIEVLQQRQEKIDYCIIGEASSEIQLGDQVRVGRRGSLSGKLTIIGKQGHIAYPHIAINPIHLALPALQELVSINWDSKKNEAFPPTSLQISNIHAGTGAGNIIPGVMEIHFNFRFSNSVTPEELQERVQKTLVKHKLNFELAWTLGGNAFLTRRGQLIQATQSAIQEITGLDPLLSTAGGTSDGRFIAPTGAEVVEVGPLNTTAHQINEHVHIVDLEPLTQIYQRILEKLLI
jgi:succinyl-diaminopimelate desuccinylase